MCHVSEQLTVSDYATGCINGIPSGGKLLVQQQAISRSACHSGMTLPAISRRGFGALAIASRLAASSSARR